MASPLRAFRHPAYAALWGATVVANIGTWMYSSAAAWLMTDLDPDPLMVSLVQVAASLPMFLFALPAGALADMVDRRRLLLVAETVITALSAMFAALVWLDLVTPGTLLLFAFLIGTGAAAIAPAWQAIVPQLVPREDLTPAIAANSVGVNISRAIGPALGGAITVAAGIAAPFWINAVANLGTLGALLRWHPAPARNDALPAERLASAVRAGLRYARNNLPLRSTLLRATGFFLCASAYWALLPLVARTRVAGDAALYGLLLGAIGIGAITGAFALPRLREKLGPDWLVVAGAVGTAITLVLYAWSTDAATAVVASLIAGASWIAALSTLNVSAQVALPEWVRGRGLAMFVTVFSGAITLGSAFWGQLAGWTGVPAALSIAAAAQLLAIPLTWRYRLQLGAALDLAPSMHWPEPVVTGSIDDDAGPVLVTVDYRVDADHRDAFLELLQRLSRQRRRDGAYAWGLFESTTEPNRYVETFLVESWLEHLRQHERVTQADRVLEEEVQKCVRDGPQVTHFVAARSGRRFTG
ncbi:MAG TPA: MFS transporter [Casimicrobiaceae bacterium]|nr:MFS transporter [Casimicrobiaceae bacterium]